MALEESVFVESVSSKAGRSFLTYGSSLVAKGSKLLAAFVDKRVPRETCGTRFAIGMQIEVQRWLILVVV